MPEHTVTLPIIFPLDEDQARSDDETQVLRALQNKVTLGADPESRADCYVMAGQIREQLGEFEAAARCYEAAVAQDAQDPESRYLAQNNLGYCLNRMGRYAEAEEHCRRAIEINAARFNAHKNLGIALERTGRLEQAAGAYCAAAKLHPTDGRALRRVRILLANHPEVARNRPDLVNEVETLHEPSRKSRPASKPDEKNELSEEEVRRHLQDIRIVEEVAADGLQVFGLSWDCPGHLDYSTLDDALAGGRFEVTELNEGGQVPTLKVSNRSKGRVLLMAGEQLVGSKQNRVLNVSIMVAAKTKMPIPVTCVEQGRWAYSSPRFATSGTSSHTALRHMMAKHAMAHYQDSGVPRSDQAVVWWEVMRKLKASKSHSPSHALHDMYLAQADQLDKVHERITPGERWSGAVFASGGTILGLDLFDQPSTLAKLWPKLVRSYASDAFEKTETTPVSRGRVEDWVRGLSRSAVEMFRSPGLGTDARLEGEQFVGGLLIVDRVPVHLEAFWEDAN